MITKEILLSYITDYTGNETVIYKTQTTDNIINGILSTHKKYCCDYDFIYHFFIGKNLEDTCKKIFNFLKKNVPYEIESGSKQTLRSPAAILQHFNGADCKSYSLFFCGVLDALRRNENINFDLYFRFAGYGSNKNLEHVYCVLKKDNIEYWCDPVLDYFNDKSKIPTFTLSKKINMALIQVSGFNDNYNDLNYQQRTILEQLKPQPNYVYYGKQNTNTAIGGGVLNLGQDQEHLKDFLKTVEDNPTAWLYNFLHPLNADQNIAWDKSQNFYVSTTEFNSFPKPVIDKQLLCNTAFFRVNGQTDNATTMSNLHSSISDAITIKLGMTPKIFWSKFLGKISIGNYGNTKPTDADPATSDQSTKLQELGASLGLTPEQVNKILNSLFGKIKIEPSIQSFAFSLNDWLGTNYPKDKNLFTPQTGTNTPNTPNTPDTPKKSNLLPLGVGILILKSLM